MFIKIIAILLLQLALTSAAPVAADYSAQLRGGLSFCGEAVDLRQPDVYQAVDQNLVLLAEAKSRVWLSLKRSTRYLPLVEKELQKAGAPDDLKYIPLVITSFAPDYSSGGRGIWRLREKEAKALGLRVDKEVDERLDPVASTVAAIRHLKLLKNSYNSWTTAMAAHLIGVETMQQLISEAGGESNYYKLYLPDGLDNLPSMVFAGKLIFQKPGEFGYNFSAGRGWPPFSGKRETVKEATDARTLAAKYGKPYKQFRDANPHLLSGKVPAGISINIP